jgi:uncharacterized HAD superfamily protein
MEARDGERLLVDVDGTICNDLPRVCEFIEQEYDRRISPEEITEWGYYIEDIDVDLESVFHHLFSQRPEWFLANLDPVAGSRSALERLSENGYDVWIATHRPAETHPLTERWLSDQGFTYDRFLTDVPDTKADVPGDILIDDYHEHIRDIVETGRRGILIDRPYNTPLSNDRAVVASGWDDVVEILSDDS